MPEIDRYKPEDRRGIDALTRRTLCADAMAWDWRYRRNPSSSNRVGLWVAREGPTMSARLSVKGLEVDAAWAAPLTRRAVRS